MAPGRASTQLAHFSRLKQTFASRLIVMQQVQTVREGNIRALFPSELQFDEEFHGIPAANFIDRVARDVTQGISPLPRLSCTSGKMRTDSDRQRAQRKN